MPTVDRLARQWNTLLRPYGPLVPWFNKTWWPGEIERQP